MRLEKENIHTLTFFGRSKLFELYILIWIAWYLCVSSNHLFIHSTNHAMLLGGAHTIREG